MTHEHPMPLPEPPNGAITYDLAEKYAVFVTRADADGFAAENEDWRVDWCVDQSAVTVQVV